MMKTCLVRRKGFRFAPATFFILALAIWGKGFAEEAVPGPVKNYPAVFWASAPVAPGEVVLILGGEWGDEARVEVGVLANGEAGNGSSTPVVSQSMTLDPLSVSDHSIKFLLPSNLPNGVFVGRILSGNRGSKRFFLNEPNPWWRQGDWGNEASPGGWLRIFGKCLSTREQAKVRLQAGKKNIVLKPFQQDTWSLNVALPGDLALGEYRIHVHNGYGGAAGWQSAGTVRVAPHSTVWKTKRFDIRDFGALPNDYLEDGRAVQTALDAAGENGGGVVFVPSGRFQINETLRIPRFVLIKGEGPELSMLYWRDRVKPLPALIEGTNSFGIEDITIQAANHVSGIVSDSADAPDAGNIFLRRVQLRMNRFVQLHAENAHDGGVAAQRKLGWVHALDLGGENIQVIGCDVYSSASPFSIVGRFTVIRGNRFYLGRMSSFMLGGSEVIFEDNEVIGGDNQAWGGANAVKRNLYYARNKTRLSFGGDREQLTSDGGGVAYVGKVASVDGRALTLAETPLWDRHRWDWVQRDAGVFIMEGRGAGQMREVVRYEGRKVEVDRPWDIEPDASSVVHISRRDHHQLLVENEFTEGTIGIQFHAQADHCILAGNRSRRAGGLHARAASAMPCWYLQFLGNEILEGSGFSGPYNGQPLNDSHLAVLDSAGYWAEARKRVRSPAVRGIVFRKNIVHNHGRIVLSGQVQDVLIENNRLHHSDVGIEISRAVQGALLLGNRFENVKRPLTGGGEDLAQMHPAERLLNRLSGQGLISPELRDSAPWAAALNHLKRLSEKAWNAEGLDDDVRRCQIELAKAAAATSPDGHSFEFLQALTGVILRYYSAPLGPIFASGAGGKGHLLVPAELPKWGLPLTLSLEFPPLPGWETGPVKEMVLNGPGKSARAYVAFTVPRGVWGKPTIPLAWSARGDGWELRGTGSAWLSLGKPADFISQWMIVGPFKGERPGELGEKVYPPERRLDVAAEIPGIGGKVRWRSISTERHFLNFTEIYGEQEQAVAFAVSVLRAREEQSVAITFQAHACYLNGKRLGVPIRYGNRKVSSILKKGDNVLMCAVANAGKNWQLSVQVEPARTASPGDVQVVPATELPNVPALRPEPLPPVPEGTGLPFARGTNWKLLYEDDFNRSHLGTDWRVAEGNWPLEDGHIFPSGRWEYLSYAPAVRPPLRIEFDIDAHPDSPRHRILAVTLTPADQVIGRALWGRTKGAGYMLSLGWHNRRTNQLWRGPEEVQVSDKGPFLQAGKRHHVTAQFIPPRAMLIMDGKVVLDYKDPNWLDGLDTLSFFSAWGKDTFDNVRIYTAKAGAK